MNLRRTLIALGLVALGAVSIMGNVAYAANTSDTAFRITLDSGKISFLSTKSVNGPVTLAIRITSKNPSNSIVYAGVYNNSHINRTIGGLKVVSDSSTYTYLPNNVYEMGDTYYCLGMTASSTEASSIMV